MQILQASTGSTILAAIYPFSVGENNLGVIYSKCSFDDGPLFQLTVSGKIRFIRRGSPDAERISVSATIPLNTWSMVGMTWNGVNGLGARIYVNGAEVVYGTSTTGATFDGNTGDTCYIGNLSGLARTFDGLISDFQGIQRVLNPNEMIHATRLPGSFKEQTAYLPLYGTASPEPNFGIDRTNGTVVGSVFDERNPPIGRRFFMPKQRYIYIPSTAAPGGEVNINLSESWTWNERITKDFTKHLLESYTFSEAITKDFLKHLTESITLVESITKELTKHLKEDFTVSESLTKDFLKHLTENITFTEAQSKEFTKHLVQVVTITDSITKIVTKHLTENWTWNDSVTAQIVIVQVALAKLITFIRRGMVGQNDKHSMETDLQGTGISKGDSDMMRGDTDEVNWDSHEGI